MNQEKGWHRIKVDKNAGLSLHGREETRIMFTSQTITTESGRKPMGRKTDPVYPGEILLEMKEENGLSTIDIYHGTDIPIHTLNLIMTGEKRITGEIALRLGRYFGTSPELWMNLQVKYELDVATDKIGNELEKVQVLER
ncbi:MAG: HigA family addiction module antidote protein [Chloroflexi bacterium]|nr:HigA family addiction module antidote protein [Chloroflexota bacterium]